jgi:hypothetical protein
LPAQLPLSGIKRMLADPAPPRDLGYRISALGDLGHRITLELILKLGFPYPSGGGRLARVGSERSLACSCSIRWSCSSKSSRLTPPRTT